MVFTAGDITVNFYETKRTEEEFLKHESHHGLTVSQLKEAYALLKKEKKEQVSK